jgi:hypothetical protein
MAWRTVALTSAIIAAAGLLGAGQAAAAAGWQPTVLPLPDGWRGGWVIGTDGKGEYSGTYVDGNDGSLNVVIWRGGQPTVVNPPAGCLDAETVDENASRVIAVAARGCGEDSHTVAYTYRGGAYQELPRPGGSADSHLTAVNTRGDVLGQLGTRAEPEVTVVWPASGEPVVIPDTIDGQTPTDIDDDGTILFHTDTGPYLWRDGTMTALTVPSNFDAAFAQAIRGGVVVGGATRPGEEYENAAAYWWPEPTSPDRLFGGRAPRDINASGLAAGVMMTWQNGGPDGTLPIPPGYDTADVTTVGDDGSVLGSVGLQDTDRPFDLPAVWRRG